MPQPYKLFTIYAREDAQYLEELRGQLRPLEHAGRIHVWSDREINPGVDWEREIVQNLDTADIILILVSAAYYNSAYIHEKEIKHAINRHERGEAKVLPVIVRPCSFLDDPVISRLQVLPTDGKPVTDRRHWQERDDAWLDVVAGVKRTLDLLRNAELQREQAIQNKKEDEKRAREEAARREREANERAENERLTQLRREQEQAARRAEQTAWQQAADAHYIPAYENYLARYPQGEYAREARFRIKELKRKEAAPLPLKRYAAVGGGVLVLLLVAWLIFGRKEEQIAQNPMVQPDSTQLSESSPSRKSGLEMVAVQGGTFTMGSPKNEDGRFDDECRHSVTVGSFSIGKYEVTQAQWKAIMGNNPSYNKGCDDCPVEQVSWNDIQEFIKKLNAATGKKYRLPTEEEWEYAARGGNVGSNTYFSYSGGNDLDAVAWHYGNSGDKTHPVGTRKANQLGLYDMSGNVWEWCQDIYKPYPCDSKNTAVGRTRVGRGGGAFTYAAFCRAAGRVGYGPARRDHGLGFRLVSVSLQ